MLLVAPLVFRAPEGPAAVCAGGRRPARWPSAPRASLGASSFLRVLLVAPRVFRALEGPAAVCAGGRRPPAGRPRCELRSARRSSCVCCLWLHGCSGRRRARPPARLGDFASLGAASRSPPVPFGPSGALHTGGAGSLIGALSWSPVGTRRHRTGVASTPRLPHCLPFWCNALPG